MIDPVNLLGFVFILGALIFIHESGHYMVAKGLGIRVEVFSLGFGPRLAGFTRGGTEYRLSAVPLGGYVKMLGENPDEALRGSREEFLSRSRLERFLVLVMGASLNIVLAVVLTAGIMMHGLPEALYPTQPAVVGGIEPGSAADAAGLRVKDEILSIGGQTVATWRDMQLAVLLAPNRTVDVVVRRDGETVTLPATLGASKRDGVGQLGVTPHFPLWIYEVERGGPADRAGLMAGDFIRRVDGQELFGAAGFESLPKLVAASAGRPVVLEVERGTESLLIEATPAGEPGKGNLRWQITPPSRMRRYGPVAALGESAQVSWEQAGVLFLTLRKLVTLQLSPRSLSGPIDIYRLTGESLRGGWITFFGFMSLVSLQLGIINLLPIPILDGGHIFILLVEGLIRRDLSMKIKERVLQFGFILLLLIMGGVISLDVYKNFFIR